MGRGWRDQTTAAGAALVLVLVGAACGSSATVGTTVGETPGTVGGPLIAQLPTSCPEIMGTQMSLAGTGGASTAAEAVKVFLAGPDRDAAVVRHQSFLPAQPPTAVSPVQSTGLSPSGKVAADEASATTVDAQAWFAHRDTDGRVAAVIHVDRLASGWMVDELEICGSGPGAGSSGGATATTGSEPGVGMVVPASSTTSTTVYPGATASSASTFPPPVSAKP